jgi:hypothetical protein
MNLPFFTFLHENGLESTRVPLVSWFALKYYAMCKHVSACRFEQTIKLKEARYLREERWRHVD